MADLITQKLGYTHAVSHNLTYTFPAENNKRSDTQKTFRDVVEENKSNIIAGGLLSVGALFIYLGVSRPGTVKAFNKFINGRIVDMRKAVQDYGAKTKEFIGSSFKETMGHILDYRSTKIVDSSKYLTRINSESNPELLAVYQDGIFSTLSRMDNHLGANDMDAFSGEFYAELGKVLSGIYSKQNRTGSILFDYATLPPKTKLKKELLESGKERLTAEYLSSLDYMGRVRDKELAKVYVTQFKQMADAITESRKSQTTAKETVLDATYGKVRELLGLGEDFVPSYKQQRYDLGTEKVDLTPLAIPDKVLSNFERNIFIDTIRSVGNGRNNDLTSLSEEDLRIIYQNIPNGYNLKDLRYLIDRVRLHGAISSANTETKAEADIYKQMEIRLKYLSNILNDVGEKELLKSCDCDFGKLNEVQRHSKLYYISKNSRRMGYEDFSIMNAEMLKKSEEYGKLELPKFADVIENNPRLYFIG